MKSIGKTRPFENQYLPRNLSPEAEICIVHCPTPNQKCKGTCEFYRNEAKKLPRHKKKNI